MTAALVQLPQSDTETRPLLCRACGAVIATTTERALYLGVVIIWRTVTFECGCCGKEKTWSPRKEKGHEPDRAA